MPASQTSSAPKLDRRRRRGELTPSLAGAMGARGMSTPTQLYEGTLDIVQSQRKKSIETERVEKRARAGRTPLNADDATTDGALLAPRLAPVWPVEPVSGVSATLPDKSCALGVAHQSATECRGGDRAIPMYPTEGAFLVTPISKHRKHGPVLPRPPKHHTYHAYIHTFFHHLILLCKHPPPTLQ